MTPRKSVQKEIGKVRPPRVHITYDVETGGVPEQKELPWVMAVLGDFSGKPSEPLAKLKDRKFTEVTLENFDDVMAGLKPRLEFAVDNRLSEEAGKIGVELQFEGLGDFSPDRVARQVDPVKKLLDLRGQLADLRGKLQTNEKLEEILQATLSDEEKLKKLQEELGSEAGSQEGDEGGQDG